MKFAKELEQESVPEWRVKYLNYKAGKKYIKAVSKAINKANGTPLGLGRKGEFPREEISRPGQFSRQQNGVLERTVEDEGESLRASPAPMGQTTKGAHDISGAQPTPIPKRTEHQSLTESPGNEMHYGSFVPTPPAVSENWNMFELPAPALSSPVTPNEAAQRSTETLRKPISRQSVRRSTSSGAVMSGGASEPVARLRSNNLPQQTPSPGRLRRIFSTGLYLGPNLSRSESAKFGYGLQAIDTVVQRERDFFEFLESELNKVETFYRQKEEQAGKRLATLREQLHEMRKRRIQEVAEIRQRKERGEDGENGNSKASTNGKSLKWVDPIKSRLFKPGANSKALSRLRFTPVLGPRTDPGRDYVRRPPDHDVSYRTAKRKLKLALQEFYRGLELLQSYAHLNRTAFRKLNKKYDKAVKARIPLQFMNEKVSKSWFVNSNMADEYIKAVEDLYARYFEKGNRKVASGKLHRLVRRPQDESAIAFRNGLFIGTGIVFTVQGLVYGAQLIFDPDPMVREKTMYIAQIYAGYFLMLSLMFMFCLDCYLWTINKINYPFIFEFDTRNNLDWRQLASFPSFFLLLFGIFIWINFTRYGSEELYMYYPVILIAITLFILFLPAPILWHKSRLWILYSHYRLFFAGYYPVEFRDFFLGDMYCSLTYATSNIELFFCLYANRWHNPVQCNSNNSRLLGFFSALPPIWRALQCIRRYHDTKNIFPHLVNMGKYIMTIMSAVTLSLYRMSATDSTLGLFITFSIINGIYTSIWDLFMDFSFFQPDTRNRFLRDILGLKHKWLYYVVMVVDPILRFGWIFYAIFTHDKQHSTIVSFLVGLAEVMRRGMWALFRVENEHCANVAQYKASRDVPLPYTLSQDSLIERPSTEEEEERRAAEELAHPPIQILPVEGATASAVDISTAGASALGREQSGAQAHAHTQSITQDQTTVEGGIMRWRSRRPEMLRARSIRGLMADAHRQDFEKRRPVPEDTAAEAVVSGEDEDDDSEEDDTGSMVDERMEARRREVRGENEGGGV